MLHPSYSELIDVLNADSDTDNQVTSRYTIVIAASKRARQLVDGAKKSTSFHDNDKAVSIAVNEMAEGKIRVKMNESSVYDWGTEGALEGFERKQKLMDKVSVPLNFDNFDDDDEIDLDLDLGIELEDDDDFDGDIIDIADPEDIEEEESELLKGLDLSGGDDDDFDKDDFEDDDYKEEENPYEDYADDNSYDDDEGYGG